MLLPAVLAVADVALIPQGRPELRGMLSGLREQLVAIGFQAVDLALQGFAHSVSGWINAQPAANITAA